MRPLPDSAKVVIIGGGIIGLSVAYHLAHLGWRDIVVLERHQLTSGTSWHAAGIVGPLRANMNLTKLAIYATKLFTTLEAETGQATGYRRTGGLWLARTPDRLTELRRIAAMGDLNGLDVRVLSPAEAGNAMPLMRTDDLVGALWVSEDGQTNPVDTCMAFAKGAKAKGVYIVEGARVSQIEVRNGVVRSVTVAGSQTIRCEIVVNCAGAWARQVGAMAGVAVPLQAVEHMYVVTESILELPKPCPILRDLDGRIYVKEDAGKLVLGGFETNAKLWSPPDDGSEGGFLVWPEDWEHFEPFLEAGLHRLPVLERTGLQHFMNGPESFTPDTRQLMGESVEVKGFFVAAGFNSIGIMSSAGVGRVMAEWIVGGEAPMDLWPVDIARADPRWNADSFLRVRIPEAVANQFDMHWPYKQPLTGRDLRRSPLHEDFAAAGAVFGAPAGWERPLWFADRPQDRRLRESYGAQSWWPFAEEETRRLVATGAFFELSPFTKLAVEGPDAEAYLQRLCARDIAVAAGHLVYAQMLNHRGGIEADVTVRRIAESSFWIVSGAATRWKDLRWLNRQRKEGERVTICDLTEAYAVLGVMGPRARELLRSITDEDLSDAAFPFGTAHEIALGDEPVIASRLSFVGELGWELFIPASSARRVYRALAEAGEGIGFAHAGHFCLDGCRLEKGFRHWGHDIGPDDTPLEAGLAFAVSFDKAGGFVGRDALLRQRDAGFRRRLLLLGTEHARPLFLHDEPVYRDGSLAGVTTSGGQGFRTGLALCFANISCKPGETREDLLTSRYEVGIAGQRVPVQALDRPPYDPAGWRMRGTGC